MMGEIFIFGLMTYIVFGDAISAWVLILKERARAMKYENDKREENETDC
jgi:hypothetical protein